MPQIQPAFLSLLQAAPSSNKSLFEAYERREQATPNGLLFHMFSRFGRKSPDTCSFLVQTAETRRHRSTAADLGCLGPCLSLLARPHRDVGR